jgi:hypothetical protein
MESENRFDFTTSIDLNVTLKFPNEFHISIEGIDVVLIVTASAD